MTTNQKGSSTKHSLPVFILWCMERRENCHGTVWHLAEIWIRFLLEV